MAEKLIGGITLPPSLQALKKKWQIHQDTVLTYEPERVFIPLAQHIGAPTEPIVKIGESVKKGQLIGEAAGFVSAAVHASVSGKIIDILPWPNQNNQTTPTVIIENDFTSPNFPDTKHNWRELDNSEIIHKIQQGGLVGKGGAAFPTHVKFSVEQKEIDTLIINGAECEPFIQSDALLMVDQAEDIVEGALIARKLLNKPQIIIGIEDDKPAAFQAMRKATAGYPFISVISLPTIYPAGGEKQLIHVLTRREVPLGKLTADIGVIVLNVATTAAIFHAVCFDTPLIKRYTTVTGDVKVPKILQSPIGTLVGELIDLAGGFTHTPAKILLGGPMMGKAIETLKVPVTKNSNGLVVLNDEHVPHFTESPCIRCNKCIEACPMRLMPASIDHYFRQGDFNKCDELLAEACISCGVCSFICPAKRNLAANITTAKQKITALKKEGPSL